MSSNQDSNVIYSDKWLTLHSNGTLTVHRYYMPSSTRTLQVSRIKSISSVKALNLSRWEFKEWGVGPTWIMWPMDWSRGTLSWNGPSDKVRERSLLIKTSEGYLHKVGVTCENVEKFCDEVEKMGATVLRANGGLHLE
jgi:hypothetical protein